MDGEVWKVVTAARDGSLWSWSRLYCAVAAGAFDLSYAENEITVPCVGKLFAYAELQQAVAAGRGHKQVWRAWATGIEDPPRWVPRHEKDYEWFWDNQFINLGIFNKWRVPSGTVFCSTIKLLERIA